LTDSNVKLYATGDIRLAANSEVDATIRVSVDNYGFATVSVAQSRLQVNPQHHIVLANGAELKALRHVRMLASMDENFNRDTYNLAAYSDTFAGSVIPIDKVVQDSLLFITNR